MAPRLLKRSDILSIYSVKSALQFNSVWRGACLTLMWLTAAGWKTLAKYWGIKWSFCHDDGVLMSANQSMAVESRSGGWGSEVGVNDRNLSNLARREIKKSQSLHHRARKNRAQIACGIRNKKVQLETIRAWYKGREIGTILRVPQRQGEALFFPLFWQGEGRGGEGRASFVSSDTYSEFLRRFSCVLDCLSL